MRRHAGGMPLLTDVSLAMRTDPLALIRGATEFVTVIYGPAVTFAIADVKVEAYRRSVLYLNLISAVDGRPIVCKDIGARDDRMGEVDRGQIEVFPKLWNLRP